MNIREVFCVKEHSMRRHHKVRMQILREFSILKDFRVNHLHLASVNPQSAQIDLIWSNLDTHTRRRQFAHGEELVLAPIGTSNRKNLTI